MCPTRGCSVSVRSLTGLNTPQTSHVYRVEFPERPGALRRFLEVIHSGGNISLFHYRNHGAGESISMATVASMHITFPFADVSKVLAGIQVPPNDAEEFDKFLKNLAYHYVEETDNPVVKKYLRN